MNKKLVIFFTISLFATSGFCADILDKYRDYGYEIKRALGLDTASAMYADTTLKQFVRLSQLHVNPLIKFRQKEFSIVTTYKQNRYSLDTMITGIESAEWKKTDTVKSLVYAPKNSWYQLPVKQSKDEPEAYARRPSYYDYTDSLIFLYPVPIEVGDTIRLLAWIRPPNITTDSLALIAIPIEYRDAILKYATYLAAKSRQHPLTEVVYKRDADEAVAILKSVYGRTSAPPPTK